MNCVGISLGMTCDAAIIGVVDKIRAKKEDGYNTCPFDEMLSNYPGLIDCLKDDFKYFCDPDYLILLDTADGKFIFNTKYRFAFNHESPGHADLYIEQKWPEGINHFVNNNYAHFIKRYTKRIKSFRAYLSNPRNHIGFILQRYNTYQIDLNELHVALKMHYPRLQYYVNIIFIDNGKAKNVLNVLQFNEDEPEMERLKYWYG